MDLGSNGPSSVFGGGESIPQSAKRLLVHRLAPSIEIEGACDNGSFRLLVAADGKRCENTYEQSHPDQCVYDRVLE